MTNPEDLRHTNEFGEIEVLKDTKYWFKRDFLTIKNAFISTLKNIPFIFWFPFAITSLDAFLNNHWVNLQTTFAYALLLLPWFMFGYFLSYIMVHKGYIIDAYAGTHINATKHANRFSLVYILNSDMPQTRKIIFIFRLIFYLLMVAGIWLYVLQNN